MLIPILMEPAKKSPFNDWHQYQHHYHHVHLTLISAALVRLKMKETLEVPVYELQCLG